MFTCIRRWISGRWISLIRFCSSRSSCLSSKNQSASYLCKLLRYLKNTLVFLSVTIHRQKRRNSAKIRAQKVHCKTLLKTQSRNLRFCLFIILTMEVTISQWETSKSWWKESLKGAWNATIYRTMWKKWFTQSWVLKKRYLVIDSVEHR